jgi:hypothetical protein
MRACIADSQLFQWFTGINGFSTRRATSKSSLERYEKTFDEVFIAEIIRQWFSELSDEKKAIGAGLTRPIKCK